MFRRNFSTFLVVAATVLSLSAQIRQDNAALRWNRIALIHTRAAKLGPPMVARALAMVQTSVFDAWAAYDDKAVGTRLGASLRRPANERTLSNKSIAIAYAAHTVLISLLPAQKDTTDLWLRSNGGDPGNNSVDPSTPAGVGHLAAKAILDYRADDGSNQANGYADNSGYVSVNTATVLNDATKWQPLTVPDGKGGFTIQKYLGAHWGLVRPFALTRGSQFRPPFAAPAPDSEKYAEDVDETLSYSENLTDAQKVIAEYWADGPNSSTPPGHWNELAQVVSIRRGHTLDQDVQLFFLVANAVFDAGIAAWDAKRAYESVRPITAVRYLMQGKSISSWAGPFQGTRRISGQNWQPYQAATFVTPPFPEFVSGHSTFSAAAAEVLKRFQRSDFFPYAVTIPAGSSLFEPGLVPARDLTLSWSTFSEAADEAGLSRRYGGIHFVDADLEGRKLGRLVGASVWEAASGFINGTPK